MEIKVAPGNIYGSIKANPSKSAMQRAVAAALLANGTSLIYNPGLSNDCRAALEVAQRLGAEVKMKEDYVEIKSEGIHPVSSKIDCGESGLGIRMFTPIAALSDQALTISGHGSLTSRPMDFFEEVLPQLGIKCKTQNGKLPIELQGPLQPKDITIDGSLSSQFLTGLLMAYGAVAENVTITVNNLTSKPYIALTIGLMRYFGVEVRQEGFEKFHFGKKQAYQPTNYTVEGDWSGAAFLLVAAAVAGEVGIENLDVNSAQSDKVIIDALEDSGATIDWEDNKLCIKKAPLKAFEIDATDCPDLFPPLVALAANCEGVTKIKGLSRLKYKESDRGATLKEEFAKLGVKIALQEDMMIVNGTKNIKGATVSSHNDHRIAMACAVAALNAQDAVIINKAEAINKSYPEFYEHLEKLGVRMEEQVNVNS